MLDYRKITGTRKLRVKLLSSLSWVPDKLMLRMQYFLQTGKRLHLKKPKLYNEFLQLYKLEYRNPEMHRCADKVEVKNFIKDKGLESLLIPTLGIYEDPEKIDFTKLPEKFVVKTSDGGGSNQVMICRSKSDITKLRDVLNKWMQYPKPKKHVAREWAYDNSFPRRIIIEELLEDPSGNPDIDDFKFLCFNGKYKVLQWHKDRSTAHSAAHYDENLKFLPYISAYETAAKDEPLPKNIKEMVAIAEMLAAGFPYVRVDLYNVGGKIYFGEMTFYPASGYFQYKPKEVNQWLGSFFKYPFISK